MILSLESHCFFYPPCDAFTERTIFGRQNYPSRLFDVTSDLNKTLFFKSVNKMFFKRGGSLFVLNELISDCRAVIKGQ